MLGVLGIEGNYPPPTLFRSAISAPQFQLQLKEEDSRHSSLYKCQNNWRR